MVHSDPQLLQSHLTMGSLLLTFPQCQLSQALYQMTSYLQALAPSLCRYLHFMRPLNSSCCSDLFPSVTHKTMVFQSLTLCLG